MTKRGFVIAAVIYALVLLAALAAGGFFSALQEARVGQASVRLARASAAASAGIAQVLAQWDPRAFDSLRVGTVVTPSVPAPPGVSVRAELRRVAPRFFVVRATADAGGATHESQAVLGLRRLEVTPGAARTRFADPLLVGRFDGVDRVPAGWTCPAVSDTMTALTIQSGASDSVFFQFGDRDWAAVVRWAASIPPGGDSLAVQYAPGDLDLVGGRFTGVTVVGGDLTLSAGAELVGIVLVRGSLVLEGAGGSVTGSVVASQIIAGQGYIPSRPVAVWSSCAVQVAGLARAWAEWLTGQPETPIYD